MKHLKTGVVNTLSFIKLKSFTVNSFSVTLTKVVGTDTLTLSSLTDLNGLDPCKDFIKINIDLLSNTLSGGEYVLSLTNGDKTESYLSHVKSYQYNNATGTSIYSDSVVLSNTVD